jgi:pimeloyl-ACP methyl ester carboxylesterase
MSRGVSTLESSHMAAFHTLWAEDRHWYAHHAAFSYDITPALEGIRVPTLNVTNTGDILHFVAARIAELRPDFEFVELDGGTSYIIRDEPDKWVGAILDFVAAVN